MSTRFKLGAAVEFKVGVKSVLVGDKPREYIVLKKNYSRADANKIALDSPYSNSDLFPNLLFREVIAATGLAREYWDHHRILFLDNLPERVRVEKQKKGILANVTIQIGAA